MANYIIQDTTLTNIANAIREKNGTEDTYKPSDMAAAISAIQAGGGSGGLTELYWGASGTSSGTSQYQYIDVTNASKIKFKYDCSFASYAQKLTLSAKLGYKFVKGAGYFALSSAIDSGAKTQTICSSVSSAITGAEVEIDVSAYTQFVLLASFSYYGSYNAEGCVYIYDIEII